MTLGNPSPGQAVADAIARSGLTIYDSLDERPSLFYDITILEERLRHALVGLSWPFANRTRAKVSKTAVCKAMGYPVPPSFTKTQPRFPGQDLDVYVQKSDNLQIWNEEVSATRRYAIIRVNQMDRVVDVRIVTGEVLAQLDRTGTLTGKYQAKRRADDRNGAIPYTSDTVNFKQRLHPVATMPAHLLASISPIAKPSTGNVLSIEAVRERLRALVGQTFDDPGHDQERLRGEILHRLICRTLGLGAYADRGQFPDIMCLALEVKLQTAATIDLGLISPADGAAAQEVGDNLRHCDMRYAVVYGIRHSTGTIELTEVIVSTGEDFFEHFQRFEGNIQNKKIQLPLPRSFFRQTE